ncbi:hypothetical protein VQ042_25555 [Aurantimonas sp. A2-1-M11]|uniref:hypothetical protein n=1 Tax=Aurantimonas sp. A2-1-M11 TaxID=3113712 RepID=UPI002F9354D9
MGVTDAQPKREIIRAARNRDQARTALQFDVGFLQGLPESEQELFSVRFGYKLEVEYKANRFIPRNIVDDIAHCSQSCASKTKGAQRKIMKPCEGARRVANLTTPAAPASGTAQRRAGIASI